MRLSKWRTRYMGQMRSCCVIGRAASALSKARRVLVIHCSLTRCSRYMIQMRGILCMDTSARSNVLLSASWAELAMDRPLTASVRSSR